MNLNSDKLYKHPILKDYSCKYNGQVIYKNKKIVKPILYDKELYIRISLMKTKIYPIKRFVYECINNISEAPLIMHLDGNVKNNCINNLSLLHIKSYE